MAETQPKRLDSTSPPPEQIEAVWQATKMVQRQVQDVQCQVAKLEVRFESRMTSLTENVDRLTTAIVKSQETQTELQQAMIRAAERDAAQARTDAEQTQQIAQIRLSMAEHAKTAGIAGATGTIAALVAQYAPTIMHAIGG